MFHARVESLIDEPEVVATLSLSVLVVECFWVDPNNRVVRCVELVGLHVESKSRLSKDDRIATA